MIAYVCFYNYVFINGLEGKKYVYTSRDWCVKFTRADVTVVDKEDNKLALLNTFSCIPKSGVSYTFQSANNRSK